MSEFTPPQGVTVYTVPGCTPCAMTKKILDQKNVPFEEVDVRNNPGIAATLREVYGATSAPVVVVSDGTQEQHWSGFRPDKLAAIPTPKM